MDIFREEVMRVGDTYRTLEETLNLLEFIAIAGENFLGNVQIRQLLEKFTKYEWTYQTIGPDEVKCL
jgi:hypothetical protein